jgi:hypothetical protein
MPIARDSHRTDAPRTGSLPASPPAERDSTLERSTPHRIDAARIDAARIDSLLARADAATPDPAPLASLVDALGPAARELPSARETDDDPGAPPLRGWMLVALLAALLAEWTSRRLRGAP